MVYQALDAGIKPMVGLYPPLRPGGPAPWTGFTDMAAVAGIFEAYRAWLIHFTRAAGVQAVDFSVGFDAPGLYLDEVHPNKTGHAVMAQAFCAAVNQ